MNAQHGDLFVLDLPQWDLTITKPQNYSKCCFEENILLPQFSYCRFLYFSAYLRSKLGMSGVVDH